MAIRIGANPIGWSNDDLQEIGGDTPLETCLAEAKQAGIEGMELGNKFPRRSRGAQSRSRTLRPRLRRRLALDRTAETIGPRGVRPGKAVTATC